MTATKRKTSIKAIKSLPALLLCLPIIVYLIAFNYLPIFGVIVAFKDFSYMDGIVNSPWVGLENFSYFFETRDAFHVISNTILYNFTFLILITVFSVIVAIFLFEISSKKLLKVYQTAIMLPNFISWVIVAYIGFVLLSNNYGMMNSIFELFGANPVDWYNEPKYWPFILAFFELWKMVGMNCLIYYAALMGIDPALFEAAELDGASKFHKIRYIMWPTLIPVLCVLTIIAIGGIMGGDFGLFYQMPMGSSTLYHSTDILSTYILRGLQNGNMGTTAAIGLFQNIIGLLLVLGSNMTVKKISPENSMF